MQLKVKRFDSLWLFSIETIDWSISAYRKFNLCLQDFRFNVFTCHLKSKSEWAALSSVMRARRLSEVGDGPENWCSGNGFAPFVDWLIDILLIDGWMDGCRWMDGWMVSFSPGHYQPQSLVHHWAKSSKQTGVALLSFTLFGITSPFVAVILLHVTHR